jgi:Tol biopolymer transport system component
MMPGDDRLDSWKAIAFYLSRDIRTVQLWEKEQGLPIHRHRHTSLPSVFAFKSELNGWRSARTESPRSCKAASVDSAAPSTVECWRSSETSTNSIKAKRRNDGQLLTVGRHIRPKSARYAAAITLSLLVGVVLGWLLFRTEEFPRPVLEHRSLPFTTYPGNEATPSFSPDSTRVTFAWDGTHQDNLDIYVKLLGPGDPVRLTVHPADDHDPVWSPDGRWIAFLRDVNDAERSICLIPALGGPERTIARTGIVRYASYSTEAPLLSWSADGNYLFAIDRSSRNANSYAITRVSIATGETRPVTFPGSMNFGESAGAVSPDGHLLAFSRQINDMITNLYVVPLSSQSLPAGSPEKILSGARVEGFAWAPDSRELVAFGELGGVDGFWRIRVNGSRAITRLTGIGQIPIRLKRMGRGRGVNLAISHDGRRLMYSEGRFDANIWRLDLKGTTKGTILPFITSTRDDFQPDYSSDGRKIAFESDRSGCEEIWVCNRDGSAPFQLTDFRTGWSGSPAWSPDRENIAFDRYDAPNWAICVIHSQGGKVSRLTTKSGNNVTPHWSRDGHWIFFASDRTGRFEIWKIPATGGPEIQMTKGGGNFPVVSVDGESIYYSKSDSVSNLTLWRLPVTGGEETRTLDHLLFAHSFAVGRKGIYFLQGQSNSSAPFADSVQNSPPLCFLDFKTRQIKTLGSVQATNLAGHIAVSPDEHSVLYGHDDGSGSDLMLVEDWH